MFSFLLGMVLVLVTFYIALIYASTAIGLLGFAEAVLLVLAFFYLVFLWTKTKYEVHVPIAVAEAGETFFVQVLVDNQTIFSQKKVKLRLRMGNAFQKKKKVFWAETGAAYARKTILYAPLSLKYAGMYTVELLKVRMYDKSGFFYFQKKVYSRAKVQVFPQIKHVPIKITESTRNFFGDSDVYDDFRPGHDKNEIFDVREFVAGDKLQSIHWKLSAKNDELMVREDSQPKACPVALLLDFHEVGSLLESDCYLSVAASLVFSLMDNNCPHYVSWYSQAKSDIVRLRVDDEEGYYLFLNYYFKDLCVHQKVDTEALYKEKYRYENKPHFLLLCQDFSISLDGTKLGVVDKKQVETSLKKLEMII